MRYIRTHILIALALFWGTTCTWSQVSYDLAITDVELFDSQNKLLLPHKTILVNGDTIAAIVDAKENVSSEDHP